MSTRIEKFTIILLIMLFSQSAFASKLAIVVGNSNYTQIGKLDNPLNDAKLVSDKLTSIGFDVQLYKNAEEDVLRKIIRGLSRDSERYEVTVIYYAGHAVQLSGENYLLPVNQEMPKTEEDIKVASIKMDDLVNAIKSPIKILIMDACRDNPLIQKSMTSRTRGVMSRGLAVPNPNSGGLFIAYATESGKLASDGSGKNSPFATALAENLGNAESIDDMFSKVTKRVLSLTQGSQRPFKYASLEDKFCLAGPCRDSNYANQEVKVISNEVNSDSSTQNSEVVKINKDVIGHYDNWVTYTFTDTDIYQFDPKTFEYNRQTKKAKFNQRAIKLNKGLTRLFARTSGYQINGVLYDCEAKTMTFTSSADFKKDDTLIRAFTFPEKDYKYEKVTQNSIADYGLLAFCGDETAAYNLASGAATSGMMPAGIDDKGSYWWDSSAKLKFGNIYLYGVLHKLNVTIVDQKTQDQLIGAVVIAKASCDNQKQATIIRRLLVADSQKIVGIWRGDELVQITPSSAGDNIMRADCK